ncbi:hypothetical protein F4820DRAFT_463704 [Hypoxylon rubiginosum]|uniref:Uncharacterized protein n=1 Tax=Hypoxylon rubiginosum TaxID=110542 RepID=A0ACB9YSC5_9PEZI|nr:hypothetical protein F4820DRAFT_463704 [Hypoxylon rubiginosum]
MADYEPLDGGEAKEWLRENRAEVNAYLRRRIKYFERVGCFACADPAEGAILVVILQQHCPYRPGAEMRNEGVDEDVDAVLEGFYVTPGYTLYAAFANVVVVKRDPTARSGYAAVSWPSTIIAPGGQYGDKEHRSRLVLPEIPEGHDELATGSLVIPSRDWSESSSESSD